MDSGVLPRRIGTRCGLDAVGLLGILVGSGTPDALVPEPAASPDAAARAGTLLNPLEPGDEAVSHRLEAVSRLLLRVEWGHDLT